MSVMPYQQRLICNRSLDKDGGQSRGPRRRVRIAEHPVAINHCLERVNHSRDTDNRTDYSFQPAVTDRGNTSDEFRLNNI